MFNIVIKSIDIENNREQDPPASHLKKFFLGFIVVLFSSSSRPSKYGKGLQQISLVTNGLDKAL
jgi:hypothetical protein